jgi:hypothetical protein
VVPGLISLSANFLAPSFMASCSGVSEKSKGMAIPPRFLLGFYKNEEGLSRGEMKVEIKELRELFFLYLHPGDFFKA